MAKKIFSFLAVLALLAGLGLVINEGIKKHELVECKQWARDMGAFRGWYSVGWQRQQCWNYGIELY